MSSVPALLSWNDDWATILLVGLADGGTLSEICEKNDLPYANILRWLNPDETELYVPACAKAIEDGYKLSRVSNAKGREVMSRYLVNATFSPAILPALEEAAIAVGNARGTVNAVAERLGVSSSILRSWSARHEVVQLILERAATKAAAATESIINDHMIEKPFGDRLNTKLALHMASVHDIDGHVLPTKSEATVTNKGEGNPSVGTIVVEVVTPSTYERNASQIIEVEAVEVEKAE